MRRLPAAVLLTLVVGLLAVTPQAVARDASPTLSITSDQTTLPVVLAQYNPDSPPLPPDACAGLDCENDANVFAQVRTDATATHVVVTVIAHDGLYVDPESQDVGTLTTGAPALQEWSVAAETPGFHTMTVQVSADGATPVTISMPYLWREGGARVTSNGSLAKQVFGANGTDYYQCNVESDCVYRYTDRLTFADADSAAFRFAHEGRASRATFAHPHPYAYDRTTGLVQVGQHLLGRVVAGGLYLDTAYGDPTTYDALAYPKARSRLGGTWRYTVPERTDEVDGVGDQTLTLTKAGAFDLTFAVSTYQPFESGGEAFHSHLHGRYTIGRNGLLKLVDTTKHVTRKETLLLPRLPHPAGRGSARTAVWLDLQVNPRKGKDLQDGNRLSRVR